MTTSATLTTLFSVLLGGGLLGSIVALLKLKPEGAQIVVSAAKDVVVIQQGALDDLRQQMADMEARFELQTKAAALALAECHRERDDLRSELVAERLAKGELRARIEALEAEVASLRAAQTPRETQ